MLLKKKEEKYLKLHQQFLVPSLKNPWKDQDTNLTGQNFKLPEKGKLLSSQTFPTILHIEAEEVPQWQATHLEA